MNAAEKSDYSIRFGGIERLCGAAGLERLRRARAAVIGLGGVGSWTVEALARSGVGALTLIDLDEVCLSNVNRQLPALTGFLGRSKVQVMGARALAINPECSITPVEEFFTSSNADELLAPGYDCVIDAIDSVANKCLLLAKCRERGLPVITTGAAGGKLDPSRIQVADLAECSHDRLLQRVRKVLRRDFDFPEPGEPFGIEAVFSPETPVFPPDLPDSCGAAASGEMRLNCSSGYGSASFVTGAFGLFAAARAVHLIAQNRCEKPLEILSNH